MSQPFASGGQSIGVSTSASVLSMNTQDWSPLGETVWIFLQSKGLKNFLQHHSSKASIFQCSAFFIVQLSHLYMTTGETIALTRRTFVGKVMSLIFNMLSRLYTLGCYKMKLEGCLKQFYSIVGQNQTLMHSQVCVCVCVCAGGRGELLCFLMCIERVTGRKARGLQMEERGCKGQTFFSLLSSRRKQTSDIFSSLYKFKRRFLLKCCVAMTPGFTWS